MTAVIYFASDDGTDGEVTGQVQLDSYVDAGVLASIELVNAVAVDDQRATPPPPADQVLDGLLPVLAIDPPSVAQLDESHVPGFLALAGDLRHVFDDVRRGDVDAAADRLNGLLARHPAHPHLAKEEGEWRLHHHPVDAELVAMWTAICAEGLARMIGTGHASRLGTCASPGCDRVYVDLSKNGSRRFCSTTCQNRVKAAAFRRRQQVTGNRWVTCGFLA